MASPIIVIAGGSGYIGKALIPRLLEKFSTAQIIILSRGILESDDSRVVWKACDLFSLKSVEEAMPEKVDLAFYLVHSMGPTAQLDQGSFADYDLILADNFGRALKKTNVQHLIYLGGLIPDSEELSLHLQSRREVEETFASQGLPTTVFRAGLVIGDGGTSFQILLKLTKRLPIMICPGWTQTLTTPVDLDSVLDSLSGAALELQNIGRTFDLAGCRPLSYLEMMKATALRMGKRRHFFKVPFFTPTLSRLWVSLITNTPKALVYPLVESLEHTMVVRADHVYSRAWENKTYADLLKKASMQIYSGQTLFKFRPKRKTVRSVQRLPLPQGKDALWIKDEYIRWLPRFLRPIIKVSVVGDAVLFSILTQKLVLLEFKISQDRSHKDRQLLYVVGGRFSAGEKRARLEFRVALNRRFVLAAIHDFNPALPWFIYKYTQAIVHLFVMKAFGRYLRRFKV